MPFFNLEDRSEDPAPTGIVNDARGATMNDISGHGTQNNNTFYGVQNLYQNTLRNSNSQSLYYLLNPVIDASYQNRTVRTRCLLGTRKEVLEEIKKWSNSDIPICWLNGPAGSGKSTIAQTVAEWCAKEEKLAASFFFFRGTGDREHISRLIPTLAFQMCYAIEGMEPLVKRALEIEPIITHPRTPLSYQFDKLIMEPMSTVSRSEGPQKSSLKKPVIVIDALDECEGTSMDQFIDTVIDTRGQSTQRIPFRLLITSRVEEHLRIKLETSNARKVTVQLKLQNFDAAEDIERLFKEEFKGIYDANRLAMNADNIPEPWPSSHMLKTLVGKANGSYIYASTFIEFVRKAGGMAHRQLLDALNAHGLDPLYAQVFKHASPDGEAPEGLTSLNRVMGVLLLLFKPLPIKNLALLLNVAPRDLVRSFMRIQSVLLIPQSNDEPVLLVHTSLRDFLVSPSRSGIYFISVRAHHLSIAIDCIGIMAKNSDNFGFMADDADSLRYAHRRWLDHIHAALTVEELENSHSILHLYSSLRWSLTNFGTSLFDISVNSFIWMKYTVGDWDNVTKNITQDLSRCVQELRPLINDLLKLLYRIEIEIQDFVNFDSSLEELSWWREEEKSPEELSELWRQWLRPPEWSEWLEEELEMEEELSLWEEEVSSHINGTIRDHILKWREYKYRRMMQVNPEDPDQHTSSPHPPDGVSQS